MKRSAFLKTSVMAAVLLSGLSVGAGAQDVADDRDASFLPPPASLLKVDIPPVDDQEESVEGVRESEEKTDAKTVTNINEPKAKEGEKVKKDLTVPPPFPQTPKVELPKMDAQKESPSKATAAPDPIKTPIEEAAKAPSAPAPVEPVVIAQPVAKAPLSDVDPETIGLLSDHNGGLGASLWKDTQRPLVDRLLPTMNLPTPSPILNDLARRLFMTTAAAPLPAMTGEKPQRSLIAQRIEGLMALGAVVEAWKMAALADAQWVDSVTLRHLAEASLIGAGSQEVCQKIPSMMEAHGKTEEAKAEWQKALLICQLKAKDDKAVQLGLDMMREQKVKDDLFISLMNRNVLGDNKVLPRQLTPLRPTTLAVLRQIDTPLPPELYARPEAALIPELLMTKSIDEKARLGLAERSAAKGIITTTQLAETYKSLVMTPQDIESANASGEKGPRGHAMMYAAMVNEQSAAKKLTLIQKMLEDTDPAALHGGQGALLADILETVPVTSDSNVFAPQAARLFALAGRPDKAAAWLKLAKEAAPRMPNVAAGLSLEWPLFVLSGLVPDGEYATGMKTWLDTVLATGDDGTRLHVMREKAGETLLVLSAAGYAVPEDAWQRVIEMTPPSKQMMPSPLLLERLKQAAISGRKGETILLGLLLMGGSAGDASLAIKTEIIRALRLVALNAEAQALARETVTGL